MKNKNVIMTLGMHRSGTSAITRGLEVLGVSLGDRLMSAIKGVNDKGFFEDVDLVKINMMLMQEMPLEWDSLATVDFQQLPSEAQDRLERACQGFLITRSSRHKLFGMKDPRLCRLLPFWQPAFDKTGVDAKAIIAIRNPISVAASLARRDGFDATKSYYLWLRYVVESLIHSQWMDGRVVVDYDKMMLDPLAQLERISQQLDLKLDRRQLQRYQSQFLDDSLRHFVSDSDWVKANVPEIVRTTYDLLSRVAEDDLQLDSFDFENRLAEIRRSMETWEPLLDHCAMLERRGGAGLEGTYSPGAQKSLFLAKGESTSFSVSSSNQIVPQPTNSVDRLNHWLASRAPSPAETASLEDECALSVSWPITHVVVVVSETTKTEDLQRTLSSLKACASDIPYLEGTVLYSKCVADQVVAELPERFREATSKDGIAVSLTNLCQEGRFDWLLPVQAGARFTRWGLVRICLELRGAEGLDAVFADEFIQLSDQEMGTGFRPDFNLDLVLSCPSALSRNWLYLRSAVLQAGGFDPAAGKAFELGMILRLVESKGFGGLAHAAEPLLVDTMPVASTSDEPRVIASHLESRGYDNAKVHYGELGTWRLEYGHRQTPLVSVVVTTKNNVQMLQRCVESLLEKTGYKQFEVLVADNQSESGEARAWLDKLEELALERVRVLRSSKGLKESSLRNKAAAEADGEYIVFLDDSFAVIRESWLDELLNHGLRPEVGFVGPKVLSSNSKIREAGLVLGLRGAIGKPFAGEELAAPGYMHRLHADQNYSALGASCLMVRKSVFEELGGFDEGELSATSMFVSADLCLRARQAGLLIAWTPHSVIMASDPPNSPPTNSHGEIAKDEFIAEAEDAFYKRWLPSVAADPAYNPNLSLQGEGFALEARPERVPLPVGVSTKVPRLLVHNADIWGCGHYRIIKPFEAMEREGLALGWRSHERLQLSEVARMRPDSVILQRQTSEHAIRDMRRMKEFADRFLVYELDDYLPNLPIKSGHRANIPKDILKSLRRAVQWCDRFVVSTEPLAEALSDLHPDIRVVKNRLPVEWWQSLISHREQSEKPRVGWAGGRGHTGDLEMIADVVAHLADKVDWVFFGMCPEQLRPFVKEIHEGVHIDDYPAKLASLNLDLAIAPLEDNLFNRCKSNLRLLEYGVCGYPVVCSDVAPYRADLLPVTLVRNRFIDWVSAIEGHIQDLGSAAAKGERLRQVIHAEWMLSGQNLQDWLEAWSAP